MEKKEKDNSLINKIEKELINILVNENNRPIPKKILINKLLKNKFYDLRIIHNVLDDLLNKNKIKYLKNGNIVIDYLIEEIDNKIYIGVISKKSNGNGFITKIDNLANEKPFFVSKNNTIDSMDGDVVKFSLVKKKIINPKDILSDAIVIEVVERAKKFLVAKIEILNDSYKIIPDDETILFDVVLDAINGLVNGDKILIKIKIIENNTIFGSVIKNIGNISDPGVDILSILIENGIEPEFSDEIINLTSKLKFNIDDYQKKIRTNLTELPFVTIDPTESKDFDDAFCVKKMSDGTFYLSVSIADVSHYIDMKSELDKTAFKRGCSIYLIDRVVPMLPHIISDDICSINPNVERLCITCDIMIDAIGDFKKINIYPSIIKSHRRFAYDEVNDFFENNSSINDSEEIKNMLLQSFELHNILNNKKNKNGYINFNLPEPMIKVDENGIPLEIKLKKSGNAQQMIEDFMIAANIAVTIHADHNK
jgi:ribonuclease R